MSVVTDTQTTNGETPVAPQADAEKTTGQIFQWNRWVHVGVGAKECGAGVTGACKNPEHFHAWIRLPNPFQVRDIVDKAKAAQARKLRELRDPESDASLILDDDLEQVREASNAQALVIDEILMGDYRRHSQEAVREVDALEDESWEPVEGDEDAERPKLWGHIDQDQEEMDRQLALPEDERDATLIEQLQSRIKGYNEAVGKVIEELEARRRKELEARSLDDLMKIVRRDRIEMTGTEVYLHTYNTWQWYVCTLKSESNHERRWKDISTMKYETPSDVVNALRAAFDELESEMRSRRAGKGF